MARSQGARPIPRQPERSCIACRRARSKREMIRIVRTPAGTVELDATGRRAGRGAYLCREVGCWETGLKGNALEHSLHLTQRLSAEERDRLLAQGVAHLASTAPKGERPSKEVAP